jgi:hypothetical protein
MSSRSFSRRYGGRNERRKIYIFTEGKKTEPNYFNAIKSELRLRTIDIRVKGTGFNTLSLVEYAIGETEKLLEEDDEVWVVFDKDDFKDFDNAIGKAESSGIRVAYSNESFELWYLLHFDYTDAAHGRGQLCDKLAKSLRKQTGDSDFKYEKNSNEMYKIIKHLESDAIKHAEKLLRVHLDKLQHSDRNPSTTVHKLVISLRKLAQEG